MKRGPVSEASAVGWSRIDIDACAPLALLVAKSRALRVPMGLTPCEAFAELSLVGPASRLLREPCAACALVLSHPPTPTSTLTLPAPSVYVHWALFRNLQLDTTFFCHGAFLGYLMKDGAPLSIQ